MSIKDFELFHGAALTKIVRSEQELTLRMIETHKESWSTYKINDIFLLLKHSLNPKSQIRNDCILWQFTFSSDQLRQLRENNAWAALICGSKNFKDEKTEICLLDPAQISQLLDINSEKACSLTVKLLKSKSLRVTSSRLNTDEIIIGKNRIDTWRVPGS